jgi:predicted transcriptional regulator
MLSLHIPRIGTVDASTRCSDRHHGPVPVVVRPDPPLPMSVALATKVYGSEVLVSLIAYYREHPAASQRDAIEDLHLPQHVVSKNIRILIEAGVVQTTTPDIDARLRTYTICEHRVRELLDALRTYCLGDEPNLR